ncbi:hypothetical protein ROHU_001661 [Labeo rohita]|uniref:Uncharacterized protein n=1 Tax=Labeo rohita TaxID=84645 RepID=A0A498P1S6_LABRO|nr:hypothetical protein ROHU_001661 [Labeo rohita]
MSRPGVFLEKDEHGVCLTITNCSYDSWSCQAMSYTNGNEDKQNFTATCNLFQQEPGHGRDDGVGRGESEWSNRRDWRDGRDDSKWSNRSDKREGRDGRDWRGGRY